MLEHDYVTCINILGSGALRHPCSCQLFRVEVTPKRCDLICQNCGQNYHIILDEATLAHLHTICQPTEALIGRT